MKVMKTNKKLKYGIMSVLSLASFVILPATGFAATDSEGTTINANIGSSITIGTSTTVTLNIIPVTGGSQTSAKDTVTISTNNAAGYDVTLADSDATTNLVNGGNNITTAATTPSTAAALSNNTWGWHVDGLSSFGSGGAVESNVTTSSIKYAGMPSSSSPFNIKTSSTTASADTVEVWYAAKVDTSKPNGTYSDIVTYTATTK